MGNQLQFYSNIACLYVSFDAKIKIYQNNIFAERLSKSSLLKKSKVKEVNIIVHGTFCWKYTSETSHVKKHAKQYMLLVSFFSFMGS